MSNEGKFLFYGGILTIIVVAIVVILNPAGNNQAEDSTHCDFNNMLSNDSLHLQPYGSEILPYRVLVFKGGHNQDLCIINTNGNPVEVETFRDEGDGKTFQEDHRQLDGVFLSSGGANTIRLSQPGGNAGLMVKITNPYNFTSDVQIVVTGQNR